MPGTGPRRGGARPHVFVDDLDALDLDGVDHHHLERVLRLRLGDEVTASDGVGRWRAARLVAGGSLEPAGDVVSEPAPDPPITVAFALTKGERPEMAVQKLTEVGVDRIVPVVAIRSIARWDGEQAGRHLERLRRIAREAAAQSGRSFLPVVDDLSDLAEVAARPGASLADAGGAPPSLATPLVIVGPEGGWAPEERALALPVVGLGPTVLRAETAAVVAGALLVALRAGIVDPRPTPPTVIASAPSSA